jgi:ribosomal protein S18 acetylase RimI-like enzyme
MLSFRKDITPEDAPRIGQMLKDTHFFDESPDEIEIAIELIEESLTKGNNVENYRTIIAQETDTTSGKVDIVGYICFARVPCTVTTFELYWLCVDKKLQGKGIGRMLIDEATKEIVALKGKKIILQTAGREQYLPTQQFYLSIGFIEEARIKDYFCEGDDCVIFTKSAN